eukprot:gnl/MRDRNA2_/MRDRNA2_119515_c0_seq1.p1 gnl/MRDRNA2_/MRDRNA2_119515_c0~~gnl/MRDRNA2_/MRDRNA2_119515_c0_seq1.p1  ORF type:complete len:335 (+),score=83.44 gnl/MRDRNA2_/MRDRNA2_119515_c0_seq1:86-1090(+)
MPPKSKASPKPSPKASPKSKQGNVSPKPATPRRQSSGSSTKLVKYTPEPPEPPAPQELDVKFRPQQPDAAPALAKALAALRNRGELCDVLLLVKGGQLPAHSVILTAQSEVLREMLRSVKEQAVKEQASATQESTSANVEQSAQVDESESVALERPSQSYNAVGVGRKESLAFEVVPPQEPVKTVWHAETPVEIPLGAATREAAEWMLRWFYGEITSSEYRPTSDDVNLQVMTLSEELKVPSLMELGASYITRGVYAHNVVQRMWMCQKYGLMSVRELLVEALVKDRLNLEGVVSNPEMSKHPELLREMLAAVANQTGPSEEQGPPHKKPRKSS